MESLTLPRFIVKIISFFTKILAMDFKTRIKSKRASLKTLFPSLQFTTVAVPDMSSGSNFFGNDPQHENLEVATARLDAFQQQHPNALLANGYLEERSFYNTPRFERTLNEVTEYRNIHLGTDFWVPAKTPVHAIFNGEIVISHHNDFHKDYGPLLVLKHQIEGAVFYTLYGHLSIESLSISPKGKTVSKGGLIGYIGDETENGHWVPHLHLQCITDLLGETENYNGVAYASELELWKQRCPDPDVLFKESLH
jgi:murein DD-endopeptidase MepM/ murein hydrolase activator NlpD|tara:strand:- start:66286 stop:67044 length:759 start_codon:yes stop_codon:yes gene_type:complete